MALTRTPRATRTPAPPPAAGTTPVVRVRAHQRSFGERQVLRDVDLELAPGEFVALLGRSGCGKSTLLRSLAGLDPAPADEVRVEGEVAVAFQEPRLLPWRRVRDNVELALLHAPVDAGQRRRRATAALEEVGLGDRPRAWPKELSGGMAQRVSLARALVGEPALLLLDEPFSALDALTRLEMHQLVIELWRRHAMAVLVVTHDVDEALALADRIVLMHEGRLAHEWHIGPRRDNRDPAHPEIATIRREVLDALGVRPTPPNPHRTTTTDRGAA